MTKKPKPIECSICGEMIEPFFDSGQWCAGAAGPLMVSNEMGEYKPVGGQFHMKCLEHEALWARIRKLEKFHD